MILFQTKLWVGYDSHVQFAKLLLSHGLVENGHCQSCGTKLFAMATTEYRGDLRAIMLIRQKEKLPQLDRLLATIQFVNRHSSNQSSRARFSTCKKGMDVIVQLSVAQVLHATAWKNMANRQIGNSQQRISDL